MDSDSARNDNHHDSIDAGEQKSQQEQQARLAQSLRENVPHVQEPERLVANLEAGQEHGELLQAASMGPYKVDGQVCVLLEQVMEAMPLQIGLGEHVNPTLQRANTEMRIALITRVLAYLSGSAAPLS